MIPSHARLQAFKLPSQLTKRQLAFTRSSTARSISRLFQVSERSNLHYGTLSRRGKSLCSRPRCHDPSARLVRRQYSTQPPPNESLREPTAQLSASQRFRKLSREYGWSVMGVYLALTALDFPFCFAAVRWLGVERIGHAEEVVLRNVANMIPHSVKETWREMKKRSKRERSETKDHSTAVVGKDETVVGDIVDEFDHGILEAEKQNRSENASIWTQLALAYAIHKSFIFVRLPLTVAITPKVVKTLRRWGWDIGKRKPKSVKDV